MFRFVFLVSLLGLAVCASALAVGGRLPAPRTPLTATPAISPSAPSASASPRPAGDQHTLGLAPAELPPIQRGPGFALRPQLEAVLTIQLLAELTVEGRIQWTAAQREQLRTLLRPLEREKVTRSEWAAIGAGWADLLTPAQRSELDRARADAEALAERRLSMSRLALLDGPGTGRVQWRYAFAIQRGTGLVRRLEEEPEFGPYRHSPYREHLATLLGR
ncbi:hypothetical protein [Deinococcus sp. SL84]|uniref:hypothetical protein n=1 Tax=Deinococcus sp. SL84 TaxID=2994663 RepID=UPI002276ABA4|nr:hypothetical protein [Deinococcus sp. SL84]MCY1701888.1 hypothetical protein [Deinococcus sp. SL84]